MSTFDLIETALIHPEEDDDVGCDLIKVGKDTVWDILKDHPDIHHVVTAYQTWKDLRTTLANQVANTFWQQMDWYFQRCIELGLPWGEGYVATHFDDQKHIVLKNEDQTLSLCVNSSGHCRPDSREFETFYVRNYVWNLFRLKRTLKGWFPEKVTQYIIDFVLQAPQLKRRTFANVYIGKSSPMEPLTGSHQVTIGMYAGKDM